MIVGLAPPFTNLPSVLLFGLGLEIVSKEDLNPGDKWAFMLTFLFWKLIVWESTDSPTGFT